MNEEFLVMLCHQRDMIKSLLFVHTARRSYRLDVLVKRWDWTVALVRQLRGPRTSLNPPV